MDEHGREDAIAVAVAGLMRCVRAEEALRLAQSCLGLAYDDIPPSARRRIFQARQHIAKGLAAVPEENEPVGGNTP